MSKITLSNGVAFDIFSHASPLPPRWVFTRSLSMINRYTGHTTRPYSVGEHSVRLADSQPVRKAGLARAAALHDFSEALLNDIVYPLKPKFPLYEEIEDALQRRIFAHWNEPWENMEKLAEFDRRICVDEMAALFFHPIEPWMEPLGVKIPDRDINWATTFNKLETLCTALNID